MRVEERVGGIRMLIWLRELGRVKMVEKRERMEGWGRKS